MKKTSRLFIPIILWVGLFLFFAVRVHAFFPERIDIAHNPEFSGQLTEVIGTHWFERKEKIITGENRLGADELEAIYQIQLDLGIKNIPLLSSLLVREGLRALRSDDLKKAEFLFQYAKKYAPDFHLPYFAMGKVYFCRNKTMVGPVLREYMAGFHAILKDFRTLLFRSLNMLYLVSGALLLTFIVFSVIMGLKHVSLYIYDLRREFDLTPVNFLRGVAKVVAFVVPVFLDLNLFWALLYWTFLLWGYMARRERHMIVLFFLVLVYVPWILEEVTRFVEKPDHAILMTIHEANETAWGRETKGNLEKWNRERPQDVEILFSLGLLNKREGNYEEATRYYTDVLEYEPEWAECISNLGNVYLATGRWEEAVEHYEQAVSISPEKASFHLNLHTAFSSDSILSSEQGGHALETANRLNPKLVAFFTQTNSNHVNRSVIDETISAGRLWNGALRSFQRQHTPPEIVLRPWMKEISRRYESIYPPFFLAFLVTFAFLCSKKNFPKRCPVCGTPSVKFFPRKIKGDSVCFACNRLFVKRDSIDPKMKEKKLKQAERFGSRKMILWAFFSFIMPGGGHLWKGRSARGCLFAFLFFILVLKFFHWNVVVRDPLTWGDSPGLWIRLVFIVVFLLYYLAVLMSALRIQSKGV